MTTTETTPVAGRPAFRGRRFWGSVLAGVVLIVGTFVAAQIEAPDPSDDRFLSPESSDDVGASILADELAAEGVAVEHHTNAWDGIQAAHDGGATVFVPAPDYLKTDELYELQNLLFSDITIVLVRPPQSMLNPLGLRADGGARIATDVVEETGCAALPVSGVVQLGRQAYRLGDEPPLVQGESDFCFDGYLAVAAGRESTTVVAGSGDPFSNEWIDEVDNKQFAVNVLNGHDRLIWLDVHALAADPPPTPPDQPTPEDDTYSPEPVEIRYPDSIGTNPIYDAMPSWMWAGLVGLLLLTVLAALWRGRRLGPPVAEPLPVSVPAAETVHGRAMLYRRAGAYPQALRALRSGALHRIRPIVGLSTRSSESEVVTAVAERSGWPADRVGEVLFSAQAENERELMELSKALDLLVSTLDNAEPQGRAE